MGSNVADRLNQIIGRFERTHGSKLEKLFGVKKVPIVDCLIDGKFKKFKAQANNIKKFYGDRCLKLKG